MSTPRSGAVIRAVPNATTEAPRHPTCVLIASHNGEANIANAVRNASRQCRVYVVSDGSTDRTAEVARAAGATVLDLRENVGKPAAIHRALRELRIVEQYETVTVIDDDTTLESGFVRECLDRMREGVGIVVGTTKSDWSSAVRWNPWVAARAFGYWKYQLFVRRGQSALNVMNCISGSNSMYRTDLLAEVARESTPYIVDDTYWTLEVHRRKLGKIVYAPKAAARVQDPTSGREWYGQNLRWLWGTMQGIRGHRIGRRASWFDVAYLGLMLDWLLYVVGWPMMLVFATLASGVDPVRMFVVYLAGYFAWSVIGAIALRRWALIPLFPALLVVDWIQRVNFVHAFVKTIRQPTVESCRWNSPTRYAEADAA